MLPPEESPNAAALATLALVVGVAAALVPGVFIALKLLFGYINGD